VRRAAIVPLLLGLVLPACAAPAFDLRPRFLSGEVRVYRMNADATVSIASGRASTSERSVLVATTTIRVVSVSPSIATLTLTVTPTSLTRNGKTAPVPAPQQIRMTVDPAGRVTQVTTADPQPAPVATADVEDLVPLIGPPAPPRRPHLGDRWTGAQPAPSPSSSPGTSPTPTVSPSSSAKSDEQARFAALRVIGDYDCAIVAVSTRRPVVRERVIAGTPLRLAGLEFAASEIAFAFRDGFPVSVRSNSESRLAISGGAAQGGRVVIASVTSLTLQRRTAPGL
jgi:hypothetical protein